LSVTETKSLDLLHRFGPMTAGDFAARAGLAPPSVTGLVDRLEKKGFARRVKDPEDGRRVLIELVAQPDHDDARLFVDFVREMEGLFAGYSVDQLETILHFLTEAARRQQASTARLTAADFPVD
jgi:DNA-binding MarR family transcriptional regulator